MALKSVRRTPGYIYFLALLLSIPSVWFLMGLSGENVPGMIGMVVLIVLFGALSIGMEALRRRFLEKHETDK